MQIVMLSHAEVGVFKALPSFASSAGGKDSLGEGCCQRVLCEDWVFHALVGDLGKLEGPRM